MMSDKLKLKYLLFFVALMIFISGCCTSKRQTTTSIPNDEGYEIVTVIDYTELSGCGFIFMVNDSTKLIPQNLPDSLKQNNLKIKIKYKATNKPNICMAGKTIDVIDIKPQ
jgi:hypothetical protein